VEEIERLEKEKVQLNSKLYQLNSELYSSLDRTKEQPRDSDKNSVVLFCKGRRKIVK